MKLRNFVDVRICAFIIGGIQFAWACIPIFDVKDLSLFARILGSSKYETAWLVVGMLLGAGMLVGSVFKLRWILLTSTKLSVLSLLAGLAPFIQNGIWTPVTLSLPFLAFGALVLAAREVILGVEFKCRPPQRRSGDRVGYSSLINERRDHG